MEWWHGFKNSKFLTLILKYFRKKYTDKKFWCDYFIKNTTFKIVTFWPRINRLVIIPFQNISKNPLVNFTFRQMSNGFCIAEPETPQPALEARICMVTRKCKTKHEIDKRGLCCNGTVVLRDATGVKAFLNTHSYFSAFPLSLGIIKTFILLSMLCIPSTLNTNYLLWHTQLIVCEVKY